QTNSPHLIVINDSTETGQANLGEIERLRQHPDAPKDIVIISDATLSDVKSAIKAYPENCPILILGQLRQDSTDGALVSFQQTTQHLREALPNPLYAVATKAVGYGVVGGNVLDPEHHASQAVDLAQQVLTQGHADNIEPITDAKTRWVFDYKELLRFGLDLQDLPQSSKIIRRDPSFYSQYKQLVWLTLGTFSIGVVVILLLIEVIRRRSIAEKLLRENEKRYRDLAETGASVFWELNQDAEFTYVSDEALALNRQQPTQILGRSLHSVVSRDDTLDFDWGEFLQAFYTHQPIQDFIFRRRDRTGTGTRTVRIFKINGKPMFDDSDTFLGYRGIQREITQEYELADTLAYQATHDWLTGLVNRYEFDKCLKKITQAIANKEATNNSEANHNKDNQAVLCCIDLDQFKIINDTAGHFAGDRLLVDIANIFQTHIRETDILSRLGGDEFGLILTACSVTQAKKICSAIIASLRAYRFEWKRRKFAIGCSIGMVPIPAEWNEQADLLSRADLACYKAKELGRGRLYIDTPGETGLDSDQSVMTHIASLHQSLEEQQFFLVQQKIQPISTNAHSGEHFEVLIRFKDKANTVMSPADFIPAMEQYGVITIIDRWVLETVLKQPTQSNNTDIISVNISGISLSDESFLDYAVQCLQHSRLPATNLCFEITETAAISHLTGAKKFIHTLKEMGAKFALDDFGSGLSSFGYLKALPVDFLKIDGSLVQHMLQEPSDLAIVQCINDIAHMLGMQTIAEFVEDQKTLDCLRQLGVDYAQGYGIEKPRRLRQVVEADISNRQSQSSVLPK
ncbi:MAG: EAL domain-containing protein, partial [Cyanobacteria bacterium J06650_10]